MKFAIVIIVILRENKLAETEASNALCLAFRMK
jgi:hypothetical protein